LPISHTGGPPVEKKTTASILLPRDEASSDQLGCEVPYIEHGVCQITFHSFSVPGIHCCHATQAGMTRFAVFHARYLDSKGSHSQHLIVRHSKIEATRYIVGKYGLDNGCLRSKVWMLRVHDEISPSLITGVSTCLEVTIFALWTKLYRCRPL
jgi:hypothetical protein